MKKEVFIVSLFIFIINTVLVITNCFVVIDELMASLATLIQNNILTTIVEGITFLGNTSTIVVFNAAIILFMLFKKKYQLLVLPIASTLSGAINTGLKYLFTRPRPEGIALIAQGGFSYPSGHAAISILFYGTIWYLLSKSNIKFRKFYRALCIMLMILITLSRVYLGVHFFSDIIGGVALGFTIIPLILMVFDKLTIKGR